MCWASNSLKLTSALRGRKLDGACVVLTDGKCVDATGNVVDIGTGSAANKGFECVTLGTDECFNLVTGKALHKSEALIKQADPSTPSNKGRCANQSGGDG